MKRPRPWRSTFKAAAVTTSLLSSSGSMMGGGCGGGGGIGCALGLSERILTHSKFRPAQNSKDVVAHEYIVQEVEINKIDNGAESVGGGGGAPMKRDSTFAPGDGGGGGTTFDNEEPPLRHKKSNMTESLCEMARRENCTCTLPLTQVMQGFVLNCSDEEVLHKLLEEQGVQSVHQAQMMYADGQNGTQSNPPSWGLDRIDQLNLPLDNQFAYGTANGSGVDVYIADTGILATHQEFAGFGSTGRVECFYDYFYPPVGTGTDGARCEDGHGHGTHIAGIVGGATTGVAKNVNLKAVKVLTSRGSGSDVGIVAAMESIMKRKKSGTNPTIVNFSLGGSESQVFNSAIAKAAQKNILVVAAAGNTNSSACDRSPSGVKAAFTVAASNVTDGRPEYSNWGQCVDIYAPGDGIYSSTSANTTSYATWSGTSMAAPLISGIASLYFQVNASMTQRQVQAAILRDTASGKIKGNLRNSPNKLANIVHLGPVVIAPPSPSRPPTAPRVCENVKNWKDDCCGDGCFWYFQNEEAGCPRYYHEPGTSGVTAGDACCHCGGGTVPPGVCIDKAGWEDVFEDGCEWYEENEEKGCQNYRNTRGSSGRTAAVACCHCGGGTRGESSFSSSRPSSTKSQQPTLQPTERPTRQPTLSPTARPSRSGGPSLEPTSVPSSAPTWNLCEECKAVVRQSVPSTRNTTLADCILACRAGVNELKLAGDLGTTASHHAKRIKSKCGKMCESATKPNPQPAQICCKRVGLCYYS